MGSRGRMEWALREPAPSWHVLEDQALPRQLPEGWEVKQSRSTGKVYYVNEKLGKTQWEPPAGSSAKAVSSSSSRQPRVVADQTSTATSIYDSPPRKSRDEVLRAIWGHDGEPWAPDRERAKRRRERSSEEPSVQSGRSSNSSAAPIRVLSYVRALDFGSDDEASHSSLPMPADAAGGTSAASAPMPELQATTTPVRRRASWQTLRSGLEGAADVWASGSSNNIVEMTPNRPMRGFDRRRSGSQQELPAGCQKPGPSR